MKILMVCLGNICRSPLAEGILRNKALKEGLNWHIESAGTNDFNMGLPPHPLSQKVAMLNGIDIRHQRARRFVATDFKKYDRIFAMAEDVINEIKLIAPYDFDEDKVGLLMNEVYPGQNIEVPDPWAGSEPDFYEAFEMIATACEEIVKKYSTGVVAFS